MKKWILFLLTVSVIGANAEAQSLKDLLYSGKLKKDSNVVIRKGDDLSSRIDTGTKKPEETAKAVPATADSAAKKPAVQADSTAANIEVVDSATTTDAEPKTTTTAKTNNQLLKEYIDSLAATLKTDVLTSKKIKKETYYLYVEYEIGTDGQVSINNVVSTPENAFLQDQVKERLSLSAPKLAPVLDSTGKPRKVKRKYNFNVTKE